MLSEDMPVAGRSPPPGQVGQVEEHMVSLQKVDGARVGLALSALDGICLRIVKVDEVGLVPNWNKENPRHQVRRGDRIIEVNGVSGNALAMIEVCKNSSTLNFLFRYTSELEQRHLMMQYRALSPEDFELLRLLDEAIPARTNVRREFIAQLPREKASACGVDKCPICLQELEKDEEITRLPCRHYFCTKCIERWLTECRGQCPICLAPVHCPALEDEAFTRSLVDDGAGSEIGRESEEGDCSALVHASILAPKIISATRCEGLGSRTFCGDGLRAFG